MKASRKPPPQVLAIIAAVLLMKISFTAYHFINFNGDGLLPRAVGVLGSVAISVFLFRGANWARLFASFGLASAGFIVVLMVVIGFPAGAIEWLFLIMCGAVSTVSTYFLLFDPRVLGFFRGTAVPANSTLQPTACGRG
jgi:hypothetical protein